MKKYVVICIFLFAIMTIILFSYIGKTNDTFKITTIKKAYNYVSTYSETETMEVGILINSKSTKVTSKEMISNSYITNKEVSDVLSLEIEEIVDTSNSYEIANEMFYLYMFTFEISFRTNESFSLEISDAVLELNYDDSVISLGIGSFSFYKVPPFEENPSFLRITKLKPLVNDYNETKTLVAVQMTLNNETVDDIIIKRITPLDLNVFFSKSEIIEFFDDIAPNEDIQKLLGYEYRVVDSLAQNEEMNILFSSNEVKNMVLPLKYLNNYFVNKLGFIIEYQYNNQDYTYYYDDFLFFNSSLISIDSLHIVTYENN